MCNQQDQMRDKGMINQSFSREEIGWEEEGDFVNYIK